PQLPPRGGPRAELPGGDQQQRVPSWSDENAQPPVPRASLDTPRGHEDPDASRTGAMPRYDDRQGPGSTAEIPRYDERQNQAGPADPQNTGQFARGDVYGAPGGRQGAQNPADTGQFTAPQGYQSGATGQYPVPSQNSTTGQYPVPPQNHAQGQNGTTGPYERPQPNGAQRPAPQARPVPREPEALPPATGPGDGRTPLYDTLETNWFRGGRGQQEQEQNGSAPAPAPQQQSPQQPQGPTGPQRSASATAWRSSPNDELVKQAERVRQPAAGGVTTSGLPRRVPRANLVPGTAQQQSHQSGPQVSRAPDDVRGRLTNLRRGIAQGRQAGSTQTGSFPRPTHQQER
ncbi:hypothetical protein N4P33_21860, partial [Streptomyces sp. 15-116A]|nr:hypothetical protein [Streptomyces sp. 15-116A]